MTNTSKFLAAAGLLAVGAITVNAVNSNDAVAGKGEKEKCFGVVKAGKNDCGSKDGSHSCAGQAKIDSDPNEWVFVPKGLCDKLTGGTSG